MRILEISQEHDRDVLKLSPDQFLPLAVGREVERNTGTGYMQGEKSGYLMDKGGLVAVQDAGVV